MESKLMPLVVCLMLCGICVGQWSSPVPLLSGSPSVVGQSLVAEAGDTMWAVVVTGQAGSSGPFQVLASWTTGGAWSQPAEVTPRDSGWTFSEPGMGRDPRGRLWVAWYRGDYPTRFSESSAVWAAYRDSAGWHPPARVCSGVAAEGPMSFASDASGNWYLGFSLLTPYLDYAYSSAACCQWQADTWRPPRYIARGMSDPFETNFLAPTLVTRPDSGLWAAYDMFTFGDSVAMLRVVQSDSVYQRWAGDGSTPAATADSSGRLWILYSQLAGYMVVSAAVNDNGEVDSAVVSTYSLGRAYATTDFAGIVWAAWKHRSYGSVSVNYSTGGGWSAPEQTSGVAGVPKGIAADANGRVYVLFQNTAGQLYSVYRKSRPGVQEVTPDLVADSRVATVVRGVLFLKGDCPRTGTVPRAELLDAAGRMMMGLKTGANDVSGLSPGIYFVRAVSSEPSAAGCSKVVVTR